MNGFQNELRRRILGGTPHMVVRRYFNEPVDNYRELMEKTAKFPFVQAQAPFIIAKSIIRHKKYVDGVVIRGVDQELEKNVTGINRKMVDGVFDLNGGCVMGVEIAHNLNAAVGDTIIVTSPYIDQLGLMPRSRRLVLNGIFDLGMYDYNATVLYMNLKDVQVLFELGNSVSGIELKVADVYRTGQYSLAVEKELGYPYRVQDWIDSNRSVFAALKLEKAVTFIVLTLIILVAGFNIVGTLINIVKKKTKEIGILRSFGFTTRQIMNIFLYQGAVMGVVGTLSGIVFSFAACLLLNQYRFINLPGDVYFIETLPVEMSAMDFILVAVAAILVSFVATIYPARKAASLVTVEALRNE
jgi:lipoprotein-releasing system permease protein